MRNGVLIEEGMPIDILNKYGLDTLEETFLRLCSYQDKNNVYLLLIYLNLIIVHKIYIVNTQFLSSRVSCPYKAVTKSTTSFRIRFTLFNLHLRDTLNTINRVKSIL